MSRAASAYRPIYSGSFGRRYESYAIKGCLSVTERLRPLNFVRITFKPVFAIVRVVLRGWILGCRRDLGPAEESGAR
jgi:hypothetical protein